MEVALIVVMLGALVVLAAPWIMRRRGRGAGAGAGWMDGTLLLTGVSPRPDDLVGEQFVTITGVIHGPTVTEHVIYQRLAVDVDQWPTMGQTMPVVYSPKNPDNWRFAGGGPRMTPDQPSGGL